MEFKTLEQTSTDTILDTINKAYADYSFLAQLTPDRLELKIVSEQIDMSISWGAFDEGILVGLVLHGSKEMGGSLYAYNTITVVVPEYRSQKVTVKMYEHLLPVLKEKGYKQVQLEAITSNTPALKSFIEVGFSISRILECYRGKVKQLHSALDENIEISNDWDVEELSWTWDWEPTWQNDLKSIVNVKHATTRIVYKQDGKIVGYLFFNNTTNRVQQFAVAREYRNKHIASLLFNALAHHTGDAVVEIINIQSEVSGAKFLNRIGFEMHLKQYEMKLAIE